MQTIRFSKNYNNKLHCNSFSTFRLFDATKYRTGYKYHIEYRSAAGMIEFDAELVAVKSLFLSEINNTDSYLDTGYNSEKTIELIKHNYSNINPPINWGNQRLMRLILVRTII